MELYMINERLQSHEDAHFFAVGAELLFIQSIQDRRTSWMLDSKRSRGHST